MKKLLAILIKEHGTALGMSPDELSQMTSLVENKKEDEIDVSEISSMLNKAHVAKLDIISRNNQVDENKIRTQEYGHAERKVKTNVEDQIKEKFGLKDFDGNLELLLEKVKNIKVPKKVDGELTDNDVKTHPLYVALENSFNTFKTTAINEREEAVNNVHKEYVSKESFNKAAKEALDILDGMNPILSKDPKKAATQRQLIVDKMQSNGDTYEKIEGVWIIKDKDGKVKEDAARNKLVLNSLVKEIATNLFDFEQTKKRETPGGDELPDKDVTTYDGELPTNKKELQAILDNENIPIEQRIEARKYANDQGITDEED